MLSLTPTFAVCLRFAFCLLISLLILFLLIDARAHGETSNRVALLGAGADAWRMGSFGEVTRRWGEAIHLCRLEGNGQTEMDVLARRGEALTATGRFHEAETHLQAGLAAARKSKQPAMEAAFEGALGNLAFQTQDLKKASDWLAQSIDTARRAGAVDIVAASTNNEGNVLTASGDLEAAVQAYRKAAESATAAHDLPLQATIEVNLARVLVTIGNQERIDPVTAKAGALLAEANSSLAHAAAITRSSPASSDQIVGLVAIARVALSMQPFGQRGSKLMNLAFVEALLRQAAATSKTLGSAREQSLSDGTLAEVLEALGRRAEAAALDRNAIWAAQSVNAKDLLWRWEWLNGRLAAAESNLPRAIGAYRRAKATLEEIRLDLPVNFINGRSSFRDDIGPLYFGLIDLLLVEADHIGKSGSNGLGLLKEGQNTIEDFEFYAVNNFLHNPCVKPPEAVAAREHVGPKDAILYPILLPQRIEVLVSLPDGTLKHYATPIPQSEAERVVHQFRKALEDRSEFDGPAQQLFDWIIRPVSNDMAAAGADTLVVIPDGALRTIPFAALEDGREFVVERMAVVTEPSIALTGRYTGRTTNGRILLAGHSTEITFEGEDFPPLPGVDKELDDIRLARPQAVVLKNREFTVEAMQRALKHVPYTMIHIASHAVFGGSPEDSFFLTDDGPFSLDRLEQSLKSIQVRDEPLDMLVFSACSTAKGNDLAALGLAGVAVKAGARSAVGALWQIDDAIVSQLMPNFYNYLANPIMTEAQALQKAQQDVLHRPRYRHPYYWAPFLLIGTGR